MKKILAISIFVFCPIIFSSAQSVDEREVKDVITSAYIEGIQNTGAIEDIRKGFHPTFNMLRLVENEVKPYPIEEWISAIEKRRSDGATSTARTEGKFISVDITGNAATVKLELYRGGKKTFTDYLVLYKFTEGWRIVSKTYYRHPTEG
ncbi:MAG: nuclear transport factor 2 family protein [Cyclobacteriaceae bacterium]|nr:nuclear transport factor 2 family protein [Cyclobacteriaceae bacterium]